MIDFLVHTVIGSSADGAGRPKAAGERAGGCRGGVRRLPRGVRRLPGATPRAAPCNFATYGRGRWRSAARWRHARAPGTGPPRGTWGFSPTNPCGTPQAPRRPVHDSERCTSQFFRLRRSRPGCRRGLGGGVSGREPAPPRAGHALGGADQVAMAPQRSPRSATAGTDGRADATFQTDLCISAMYGRVSTCQGAPAGAPSPWTASVSWANVAAGRGPTAR